MADSEKILGVANRIASTHEDGNQVVVVVSAMGNTTDHLIELAEEITNKAEPREMDVLLSTGELMSCTLVAMALRGIGKEAISLSGGQAGIHTDDSYGKARIADIEPHRIKSELEKGKIVVIAGFQGITDEMDVTTLGRGGSDTTAVAIAAGLNAERCEIYTDVDGIFTADPRLVPQARRMTEIGFEEMLELASLGAKMNPRSIELGMHYNVPILVASSFRQGPGTLIHGEQNMASNVGEIRNRVRGIATDTDVAKITVIGVQDRPGIAATLFESLSNENVSVDVIVQNASINNTTDLTFTVKLSDLKQAISIVEPLTKQLKGKNYVSAVNLAKISIVGTGMQDAPGYASKMFRTLAENGINIDMITTSEIRITCLIDAQQISEAAQALHKTFDLDAE